MLSKKYFSSSLDWIKKKELKKLDRIKDCNIVQVNPNLIWMQKHILWSHNTVVLQTQSDESSFHLNTAAENSVSIEIIYQTSCPEFEFETSRALIQ